MKIENIIKKCREKQRFDVYVDSDVLLLEGSGRTSEIVHRMLEKSIEFNLTEGRIRIFLRDIKEINVQDDIISFELKNNATTITCVLM